MHLIETYALTCGAKINKPYIYEKYIPLPLNEYIVLQPHSKPSKTYDLWQEVIDILFPILNKVGISIVQIGGQNENAYRGVVNLSGKVDVNQSAYIIRNAKLFLGVDSFGAHLASHFDIPIVSLYSNNNIPNVRPYFGSKEKQVLLEPERNTLKPTYSLEENPKSINRIPIESIVNNVLKLLNINGKIPFKTIFTGDKYAIKLIEMVPDGVINTNSFGCDSIIARMDLVHNEEILKNQMQVSKVSIVCDKPINQELIKTNKHRILQIVYIVKKDIHNPEFAHFIHNVGVNCLMITYLEDKDLNPIKLHYMDLSIINKLSINKPKNIENKNELFYKSSKLLLSKGDIFSSEQAWRNNVKINNLGPTICKVDALDDYLLKDVDYLCFLEKDNT